MARPNEGQVDKYNRAATIEKRALGDNYTGSIREDIDKIVNEVEYMKKISKIS